MSELVERLCGAAAYIKRRLAAPIQPRENPVLEEERAALLREAAQRIEALERVRECAKCSLHPDVDAATMWGCPDCVVELRRRLSALLAAAGPFVRALERKDGAGRPMLDGDNEAVRLVYIRMGDLRALAAAVKQAQGE